MPSKTWILYKSLCFLGKKEDSTNHPDYVPSLFPSKNKINTDTTQEESTRVERFQRRIKRFKGSTTGNKDYVHKPTP